MGTANYLERLKKLGVIIDGHFALKCGDHSNLYFNKDAIYAHPVLTDDIAKYIALAYYNSNIEVVCGPAVGGALLAQAVARHLTQTYKWLSIECEVLYSHADKDGEDFVIKRGYEKLMSGKRVLMVEDVLTKGTSAKAAIDAVRKVGGEVVDLYAICNRGEVTRQDVGLFGEIKIRSLVAIDAETFPADTCPLCTQGIAIDNNIGKGSK
jgi:Orotate phosphoribosyltransferase